MGDMIDRDAVLAILDEYVGWGDEALDEIRALPTAIPAEDVRAGAQMADLSLPTLLKQTREDALQLAVTVVRQALVDAAWQYKADRKLHSAMFKAETHATNAILSLIPEAKP